MNVYLDYAANTPVDPAVLQAMVEFKSTCYGNPSSPHRFGQNVKFQIEKAREQTASALKCLPKEIVFTSGGTESNNLALMGAARTFADKNKHIIVSLLEHPSVLNTAKYLQHIGFEVSFIIPGKNGIITLGEIKKVLKPTSTLISVMHTNNETGVINNVEEIAEFCFENGMLFHTDAVQAFGKIDLNLQHLKADFLSVSAHKIYGPEGVGALYVRSGILLESIVKGGSQEANLRAGTPNSMGIIGLGKAAELFNVTTDYERIQKIKNYFERRIKQIAPFARIIAEKSPRSPYICNIAFPGIDNETMLINLDLAGIAASSGSACSSGSISKSKVLQAMNLPAEVINSAIRFSFGKQTTIAEIDYTLQKIAEIIKGLT